MAIASVKKLLTEIAEVGSTGPGLVGRVEVVSASEAESGQPVGPSAEPVLLLRVLVYGHREVPVARGSEPPPAVSPSVLERVRRVEPVPASGRARPASPPSLAQPVEVGVAVVVLVVAPPSRDKLPGWPRRGLPAAEEVVVVIVPVMTRMFSAENGPMAGTLLPVEGVMKVTAVVVVVDVVVAVVQEVLEMVLGILPLKR